MHLKRTVLTLAGTGLVCAGAAVGAPIAAVAGAALAVGTLAGFSVLDAREGRRKHFDQDRLREADKTIEAYCKQRDEQKRQAFVEPTVGVITHEPWWQATELEQAPASQYCAIHRKIVKDINAGTTIDARYHSLTECLGRGYWCLADRPQKFIGTDVYGSALVPTTARPTKDYMNGTGYPFIQDWDSFRDECQAVIDYCGRR